MKVLVVNCGSSSVKYTLFSIEESKKLAWGVVECIGLAESFYTAKTHTGSEIKENKKIENHTKAVEQIINSLLDKKTGLIANINEIAVVGHRIVHGGDKFSKSVIVTEDVKEALKECFPIAPLHTPAHYAGIEAVQKMLPGIPNVLVFDTAFHQTMPDYAYMYALPYEYYEKHHVRRYGFHGTSHNYVSGRAAAVLGKPIEQLKLITCHLGNGSSITAINGGKVVDTSMGFTPLAGVVMGTRCGDIDPAIIPFLMENEKNLTPEDVNNMMNKKSGLLGISGLSSDMRAIVKAVSEGNEKAKLAFDMICYSIKKYIASYFGVLNGCDAVIFTAGIGENSPAVREQACAGLESIGIEFDSAANAAQGSGERYISKANSKVKVMVVPTNEELMIAREAVRVLKND
jgi:acetate kinase